MTIAIQILQPEDFWIRAPRKGIVVFALPGEPGLTELVGDFKVQFHDRQGDFYWSANNPYPCYFHITSLQNFMHLTINMILTLKYNI